MTNSAAQLIDSYLSDGMSSTSKTKAGLVKIGDHIVYKNLNLRPSEQEATVAEIQPSTKGSNYADQVRVMHDEDSVLYSRRGSWISSFDIVRKR